MVLGFSGCGNEGSGEKVTHIGFLPLVKSEASQGKPQFSYKVQTSNMLVRISSLSSPYRSISVLTSIGMKSSKRRS